MTSTDAPPAAEPSKPVETPSKQSQPDAPPKLSGAEIKKQKAAEKAARRAQAAQEKQVGAPAPPTSSPATAQKGDRSKAQKPQQKRRGSVSGSRDHPIRTPKMSAIPEVPKKEDKTVEFFRHLYKPRMKGLAGAGKDVHPAVLALGIQMSNYSICGSNARLVATLQAFKRV